MSDTEVEVLELETEENDVEDAEEMEEEKPKKGKKGKKELKGAYKSKSKATRITRDDDIPGMEFLGTDSNKQHHMNDINSWHDFNDLELYELAKFGIRQSQNNTDPKKESAIATDGSGIVSQD